MGLSLEVAQAWGAGVPPTQTRKGSSTAPRAGRGKPGYPPGSLARTRGSPSGFTCDHRRIVPQGRPPRLLGALLPQRAPGSRATKSPPERRNLRACLLTTLGNSTCSAMQIHARCKHTASFRKLGGGARSPFPLMPESSAADFQAKFCILAWISAG